MLKNTLRTLAALVATGAAIAVPLAASAQTPSYATREDTIHGTIVSIDGPFAISVRDERGFVDKVALHQGTVINPTGLTLAAGQTVTILGRAQGTSFAANEIDTPYQSTGASPYADESYAASAPYDGGYPYVYGGSPYAYGGYPYYGSSVAIGVGVGGYYPAYGYYPSYGYAPNYGYYAPGNYHHGPYSNNNGGHAVPAPYHTYPYHNPAPQGAAPGVGMPRAAVPAMSAPQTAGGYHGFGTVRASSGGYRGFSGGPSGSGMHH